MQIVAIVSNIVLFGFTCLVLGTDGPPAGASYTIFTILLLLVPVLTLVAIFPREVMEGRPGPELGEEASEEQGKSGVQPAGNTMTKTVALVSNVLLLGFVCWAIVDQYPHPEEDGVVPYTIVVLLTPILSLLAITRRGAGNGWSGLHLKRKVVRGMT